MKNKTVMKNKKQQANMPDKFSKVALPLDAAKALKGGYVIELDVDGF